MSWHWVRIFSEYIVYVKEILRVVSETVTLVICPEVVIRNPGKICVLVVVFVSYSFCTVMTLPLLVWRNITLSTVVSVSRRNELESTLVRCVRWLKNDETYRSLLTLFVLDTYYSYWHILMYLYVSSCRSWKCLMTEFSFLKRTFTKVGVFVKYFSYLYEVLDFVILT